MIQGIIPGVQLIQNSPEIMISAFVIIFIANILMFVIGAVGAQGFTRLLNAPEPILMGFVLMMSLVGAFAVRGNPVDVIVAVLAGALGVVMRIAGIPMAPIVIGMALGQTLEKSLRQGLMLHEGNFLAFFKQPIALVIFTVTFLIVVVPVINAYRKKRAV